MLKPIASRPDTSPHGPRKFALIRQAGSRKAFHALGSKRLCRPDLDDDLSQTEAERLGPPLLLETFVAPIGSDNIHQQIQTIVTTPAELAKRLASLSSSIGHGLIIQEQINLAQAESLMSELVEQETHGVTDEVAGHRLGRLGEVEEWDEVGGYWRRSAYASE